MALPSTNTVFLPLAQLQEYEDKGYYCRAIVFSPETENNHFEGCPPYICMVAPDHKAYGHLFFEVPKSVAYYGSKHAGYTMAGKRNSEAEGRRALQRELCDLLGIF